MLTKSDILAWLQCPRRLWLTRHRIDLAEKTEDSRRKMDGDLVHSKAREQLPSPVLWVASRPDPVLTSLATLKEMAKSTDKPVVEATLVDEGVHIRADILLPDEEGYIVREVKSSTVPLNSKKTETGSPEVHHVQDLAIQVHVLKSLGLPIAGAQLGLLDSRWEYQGDGDYTGLFYNLPVTEAVEETVSAVPSWIALAEETVLLDEPVIHCGSHCNKPHACPFIEHCKKTSPPEHPTPLTLLPGIGGKSLAKALANQKGYVSLLEPSPDELVGKDEALYCRMQRAHALDCTILEPGAAQKLARYGWPRYFLDFEGIDHPIPRWKGVRPYEQVVFQYSLHVQNPSGPLKHSAFLDLSGNDPSRQVAERLVSELGTTGPILVYFIAYEKGRLTRLAERFEDLAKPLGLIIERLVDLLPLVRDHYYAPSMRGSFSIKSVLPAMAPHLSYSDLSDVQDGTAAQVAYLKLCYDGLPPAEQLEKAKNLLLYCERDTWAMVEVARVLEGGAALALPPSDWSPLRHLGLM